MCCIVYLGIELSCGESDTIYYYKCIIIIIITIIMRTETYCHFRDRGRMVVGFTTTYASTYHHCEFESRSW